MYTLTPEQEIACQSLVEFILSDDNDERCIILQGHAGTGKTTIIDKAVAYAKSSHSLIASLGDTKPLYFYFTAMTHKAKHALAEKTPHEVTTLHKLLHIIPDRVGEGFKVFSGNTKHIIIVDECSYIDYQVLSYITKILEHSPSVKFIFMGDNYQLTPVGLNHCPIFMQGYPTITLTQVMRQENAPTITKACEQLRQAIKDESISSLATDDTQLILMDKKSWDKAMINAFKSDNLVKVIRYSNHQVKQTNGKMFKHFTRRRDWQKGDVVINNSFYTYRNSARYSAQRIYSDTELIIDDIQESGFVCNQGAYRVLKVHAHNPQDGTHHSILTPMRGEPNPKDERGNLLFADLRPAFACTVHKAQGSTYDEVFINLNDFKNAFARSKKDTFRLLYVAFSRAKSKIYLTGDIV